VSRWRLQPSPDLPAAARLAGTALWLALSAVVCGRAFAEGTDNHAIRAVPTPGRVTVDGDLGDWDQSGRILVCSDVARLVGRFSAWVSMMYDAEALYVGVDWSDPTPMVNNYDPSLDIDRRKCFHSDSIQLHLKTDITRKVIGWYYTRGARPGVIALDGWMPWHDDPIVYIDGMAELGISQGFAPRPDGRGYSQELRIPWKAITKSGRAYRAGEGFECMLDLVWGPDSGKGWPVNHMMDLVRPGAVHTGWFWEVNEIYGRVELSPVGRLEGPSEPPAAAPERRSAGPQGTFPVRVRLSGGDARAFTLVIEDADGRRIRSLCGDCAPEEFAAGGASGTVEVMWDCLDDRGRLVAPGTYRVAGLVRGEITPVYEMCFYNPGVPPWPTRDGRGAWGADHSPPGVVAAAADRVVIGWHGAEGGSGIVGLGPDGLKKWGEHQGATALAVDEHYVYFMLNDPWARKRGLARLDKADGSYRPYLIGGRQTLPVELETVFGGRPPGEVVGMAVHGKQLVLATNEKKLAVLDAESAKLAKLLESPANCTAIAFDRSGALYALLGGKPHALNLDTGAARPIPVAGLADASAMAIDPDGNIAVADMGPDSQVKVYSPSGRLLRTAGRRGGRPPRGPFDPQAMTHVSSIAFDSQGLLWAVESWEFPRRVSVWGRDGRLVRDYVGNAPYAACGTYLHDRDPALGYCGPVEMRLDRASRQWRVTQVLWVPDGTKGERLGYSGGLATPQRLASSASGALREYAFCRSDWGELGLTVFMERRGRWAPVAAITPLGHISGRIADGKAAEMPGGEFAGCDPFDGVFWNDLNGDGVAQRAECEIVPARRKAARPGEGGQCPLETSCGWGTRIADDLSIYVNGITVYRPIAFSPEGAPRYGASGMQRLPVQDSGDMVPVDAERRLLVLSSTGYGGTSYVRALEYGSWRELWRYPSYNHGVHGSHHAPMPEPGRIIGALKICGVARVSDEIGSVFAVRGNLGQDFLMTTDGLYVGAMFRDSRMPGPALPDREEDLVGRPAGDLSEGGEPFNGWFGTQADGKIRMLTGIPGQAAMVFEVRGLETLRRFRGPDLRVDLADLVRAEQANAARTAPGAERRQYTIRRRERPPVIDARDDDWRGVQTLEIAREGSPERAGVRLGWDERCLYALFEVEDRSPWRNEGRDWRRLFKTGDAVDLQLSTDPAAAESKAPGPSHLRLVFAPLEGRPACVLMRPVAPGADRSKAHRYGSPVGERGFDVVELLASARVEARVEEGRYWVEAELPLAALSLSPAKGMAVRGDAGFISSDELGVVNVARTYWSNRATNLTNDLPSEAWLYPAAWGEFRFE